LKPQIQHPFNDSLILDWRIPGGLTFLEYNRMTGVVQGMNQLQALYVQRYGPGDYVPPPVILYWSFRAMVGAGLLMILFSLIALFVDLRNIYQKHRWFLSLLMFTVALPYIANTTGWIVTEVGRYPWVVYELVLQKDGVSKVVSAGEFLTTLIGFILIYGLIIAVTVYLMIKNAKAGPSSESGSPSDITPSIISPADTELEEIQ
jgi:cytochrome d ubiquinol oxidase subunit I